jgi:hypothetical protein
VQIGSPIEIVDVVNSFCDGRTKTIGCRLRTEGSLVFTRVRHQRIFVSVDYKTIKVLCFDTFLQVFLLNGLFRDAGFLTSKNNYLMATPEYWDEILAFFAGWAQKTNEL